MKILVVDDEKLLVKGVKFNLENEGYEVMTAYDGASAVELARKAGVSMPIAEEAYQVLYEGRDPKTVLQELMRREKRHEMEETWI